MSPLRELLDGLPVDVDTDPATMAEAAFDPFRVYRYALTRTWDDRCHRLPWVMLNPSTADAFRLDPTVTRCARFSRQWGCGGLVVLNLYAIRSTDPRQLRNPHPEPIGEHNDEVIARLLEHLAGPPRDVVCAWGANANPGRGYRIVQLIRDAGHRPVCLGRTKGSRQPRHPLYIRSTTRLEPV